ncbi:hypothetical protein CBF23_009685 [Marinomonas agarivorans]|nr:hypothetical protein CBF23_009685 [Marinomonas agarivorans]
MLISKFFGSESRYLTDLSRIRFSFGMAMTGVDFSRQQKEAWESGKQKIINLIDTMIEDISYSTPNIEKESVDQVNSIKNNKVFIVHGHDGEAKVRTARFLEKLGFEAIILHEQASGGKTIIEKIEEYSDVGFAIVLYTPDDVGSVKTDVGQLKARARQNVVFEHGYLMGKIGRENVVPLVTEGVELPNDISGMVYISNENWDVDVAREMKAAGYGIDMNKLFS